MNSSLDKYISELLFYSESVIVPGFGSFSIKCNPASIHPTQHTFSSPTASVCFDADIKEDDGLLAAYISKTERENPDEVYKKLAAVAETLNSSLAKKEIIDFKHLGKITFDIEKNLRFEPDVTSNFLRDSFGLESLQSPPIKRINLREKVEAQIQKDKLRTQKFRKIKIIGFAASGGLLVFAGIIFLVIRLHLFSTIDFSFMKKNASSEKTRSQKDNIKTAADTAVQANNTKKDSVVTEPVTNNKIKTEKAQPPIQKPEIKKQDVPKSAAGGHFHIVAGTFNVFANATKFVNELKQKGYDASIVNPKDKAGYKVAYGTFSTKADAANALAKIQVSENKSAWLLVW